MIHGLIRCYKPFAGVNYEFRFPQGFDPEKGGSKETGYPTREKLEELNLKEVANELGRLNLLG